jgi:phosphoribosylglycinamide formyltransferase-1
VLVASDRSDAGALARAAARRLPTALIASPTATPRAEPLDAILRAHQVDVVALAGYLRLVPPDIVEEYRGRIVNVHPALLPAFGGAGMYGARVHQAVLDAGSTVTGVTVHFVDRTYDRGPIIAQWPVPVLDGDTAGALAARVLRVEHVLYPMAVDAVAAGHIALRRDGKVERRRRATMDGTERIGDWTFSLASFSAPQLATDIGRVIGA